MPSDAIRQTSLQHRKEIRNFFAEALGARFGRAPQEIRDQGLSAKDFHPESSVELSFPDGSTMTLRHAFAIADVPGEVVGVFSEHCGYFCFPLADFVERRGSDVVARHVW